MKISVTLDVFSGRPNPSWELSPSESGELVKELSPLPGADKNKAVLFDGLGYRGFIISVTGADASASLPPTTRVYNGYIFMNEKVFTDQHGVEKKLMEQAREKGYGNIIETKSK